MHRLRFFLIVFLVGTSSLHGQEYQPTVQPPSIDLPRVNPFQIPATRNNAAPALQNLGTPNPGNALPLGASVQLSAVLDDSGVPLQNGLMWRVYSARADDKQGLTLVTQTQDAQPQLRLPPGLYVVNAAFGRATVTKRLQVSTIPIRDRYVLNAGGLLISGVIGDKPLPDTRLSVAVYLAVTGATAPLIQDAPAGKIIRLPAGDYRVVSRYGDANAMREADVRVEAGKVTEATFNHRAGAITLKLVREKGGEALANTTWSVLTPGGDTVKEFIGAFPSVVLATGDYTAIARNDGRSYTLNFKVENGANAEMELVTQ